MTFKPAKDHELSLSLACLCKFQIVKLSLQLCSKIMEVSRGWRYVTSWLIKHHCKKPPKKRKTKFKKMIGDISKNEMLTPTNISFFEMPHEFLRSTTWPAYTLYFPNIFRNFLGVLCLGFMLMFASCFTMRKAPWWGHFKRSLKQGKTKKYISPMTNPLVK